MDLVAAVVADEQPLELVQPGEGALDDPADTAQAGAMGGLAAGDLRADAASAQLAPVLVVVVAAVGGDPFPPATGPGALAADGGPAPRQYQPDRARGEPLLAYGRCLAHFAVDPDLVYVTTRLAGHRTRFLPFNKGKYGGAGNPPVPPTQKGYATGYLWEETWARDSVLDLVRQFIHEVEEEDDKGRKTGRRFLIFPRYQQLDCVRRLVTDARAAGAGQPYLIQHSAGSGQSITIAWLGFFAAFCRSISLVVWSGTYLIVTVGICA